mmetsp:Transcript_41541/g.96967  ORF Transcript_41541/g.96967 Transcript_41541/m.96967 type:complete len:209 (+) Transcript_41541:1037-1663(+)
MISASGWSWRRISKDKLLEITQHDSVLLPLQLGPAHPLHRLWDLFSPLLLEDVSCTGVQQRPRHIVAFPVTQRGDQPLLAGPGDVLQQFVAQPFPHALHVAHPAVDDLCKVNWSRNETQFRSLSSSHSQQAPNSSRTLLTTLPTHLRRLSPSRSCGSTLQTRGEPRAAASSCLPPFSKPSLQSRPQAIRSSASSVLFPLTASFFRSLP